MSLPSDEGKETRVKILHLLREEPRPSELEIIEAHGEEHEITVINLDDTPDYRVVLRKIEESDRVFSW